MVRIAEEATEAEINGWMYHAASMCVWQGKMIQLTFFQTLVVVFHCIVYNIKNFEKSISHLPHLAFLWILHIRSRFDFGR